MTTPALTPPATSPWLMYRALVGVGMLCGLLIVSVFTLTLPVIESNRARALERAVFRVLPGALAKQSLALDDSGRFRAATREDPPRQTVHAGYDAQGVLVGVAVPGQGMGYQDIIELLYGYSPHTGTIVGLQVLASRETPGLGDRIEKDAAFLANFTALDVALDGAGLFPANPVAAVKSGQKSAAWQIDGITGATISSVAIAKILRDSNGYWLPAIQQQLGAFTQRGGSGDE